MKASPTESSKMTSETLCEGLTGNHSHDGKSKDIQLDGVGIPPETELNNGERKAAAW